MTQYNIKLSNLQRNKLKSRIKNDSKYLWNFHQMMLVIQTMIKIFHINNFPPNTWGLRLWKAFANDSSANIKLSKNKQLQWNKLSVV